MQSKTIYYTEMNLLAGLILSKWRQKIDLVNVNVQRRGYRSLKYVSEEGQSPRWNTLFKAGCYLKS